MTLQERAYYLWSIAFVGLRIRESVRACSALNPSPVCHRSKAATGRGGHGCILIERGPHQTLHNMDVAGILQSNQRHSFTSPRYWLPKKQVASYSTGKREVIFGREPFSVSAQRGTKEPTAQSTSAEPPGGFWDRSYFDNPG